MKLSGVLNKIKERVSRHGRTPQIEKIDNGLARGLVLGLNILGFYFFHPDYFFNRKLYLSNVELVVTTNCTLRCRDCCHYIPRFKKAPYESSDLIISDLEKLLQSVKRIDEFRVMGGEPLLYPGLYDVISYLEKSDKIGIIEIVTNGTLSLGDDILGLFPSKKLNIFVSNYGELSKKLDEYRNITGINKTIASKDYYWQDHGGLRYRGKETDSLEKQFRQCSKEKYVLYQGKLFNCACSAFGSNLHAFELENNEFADVRGSGGVDDLTAQIRKMKERKYFTACNYCYWGTEQFVNIKAAEQL